MLKTEKLLNSYGLTFSEAEALLKVDVLSSLMKAKENDKLALHVSSLDERITQYLQTQDIKDILDANRKEAIGEALVDDFEQDLSDFDLDFDDLESASGFDVRVTDIDIDDLDIDDIDEIDIDEIDPPQSDSPIMTPAPKLDMVNALIFQNVSASNFFTQLVKMEVPEVDSDGALVFNSGKVLIRGLYESNFSRLGSMALSNADMVVEIVSKDAEAVVEYKDMFADGGLEKVDKDILSFSREEVSKVFNTQQYLKNGNEVNTSFDAIKSILDKENNNFTIFDKSVLDFSVGKAVHPNMVVRSNFYITPKTLYGLANCDEFFSASIGGYRYITNYCEANDLKQLRIFEIGGSHLNVPFSNTRNETITDSIVQDEFSAFSSKVGGIVQDTYTQNESLYEVGFTQILPKEIKYDKISTLSESAGYFVFCSPNSARTFYISAVVYNYFKKFYGVDKVRAGTITHNGLYTLYFVNDSDVQGFIMIEKANAPSSSPARLLPKNPLAYAQKILGENAVAFADKVNIEDEKSMEFMGKVKSRPVVVETSFNDLFKEQILLFEQALEFMEVGEDDEQITLLKESIEGAKLMLDDDDEEQAEEAIKESIAKISAPEDELGQVAVANDQDILPTPSADDLVMEEVIEDEKEEVLDRDSNSKNFEEFSESLDVDMERLGFNEDGSAIDPDYHTKVSEQLIEGSSSDADDDSDSDDIDFDLDDEDYDISDYYAKGGDVKSKLIKDLRKKLIGQDKYIVSHFYDYDGFEDKSYSQIKTIKEGSAVKSFKTITNGVWVDEKISVPNDKYVIEKDTIGAYGSDVLVINKSDLKELSEEGSIEDFRLMWLSDFSEEKWNKWGASLEQQWEFKIGELTDRPFAKGGKVEDGNSTAIPITGSLEGVDVKKVFEEGSDYHDFHEYTREEIDAIKKSEGSESDAYNAITLPKNFPWQTAEIISSVDPFEYITESTGWLVENGYDPKKYALWVHSKFGKNPKLLTNLIAQNDESYFDVVFLVEISKDEKEYLERSNPFRSSYYAHGGEVTSDQSFEIWEENQYGDNSPLSDNDRIIWQDGFSYIDTKFAKGGKTPLDKEFKFEKNFVIYVPSTSNVGDRISETELNQRLSQVQNLVADEFGGFTKTETDGGYKSQSGEIIEEDIVKVSVFSTDKAWDENEKGLIRAVKGWAKEWGQEAIGFEYEGDLYYIDATGKMAKGGKTYAEGGEVAKEIYDTFSEYLKVAKVGDIIWRGGNIDDFKYVSEYNVEKVVKVGQDSVFVKNIGDEDKMAYESPNENSPSSIYSLKTIVVDGTKYAKGGSTYAEGGDLFEHYERLPDNVQELYFSWGDRLADGAEYEDLKQMLSEFEELGYTFDYGLDAEPYDLRAIDNVKKAIM